LRWTFSMP